MRLLSLWAIGWLRGGSGRGNPNKMCKSPGLGSNSYQKRDKWRARLSDCRNCPERLI